MLIHLAISLGGMVTREAVIRGYGVNALEGSGKVCLFAKSVTQSDLPKGVQMPTLGATLMLFKRLQVRPRMRMRACGHVGAWACMRVRRWQTHPRRGEARRGAARRGEAR